MLELYKTQQSVSIYPFGYSTYCGFVAQYISFIDMEINEMMARPVNYPFRMISQYTGNFVQSYITRVITEQVNLWVSLLERTEQMTVDLNQLYKSYYRMFSGYWNRFL